jgi:dethiobiotin synthetase
MRAIFVSGTDTGCGKTAVATSLARAARERGLRVRVLKPVETGCASEGGDLVASDALKLARAAKDTRPLERICPYRFRMAAAPEIAARAERKAIDPERIDAAYQDAAARADLVLVEGAGGLLVPLAPGLDMAGLARRLGLPLLIVARAALGTLNHTKLSLEAARGRGLRVLGVLVSHTTPRLSAAERANLDLLLEQLSVPFLGELPFGCEKLDPTTLLDLIAHP